MDRDGNARNYEMEDIKRRLGHIEHVQGHHSTRLNELQTTVEVTKTTVDFLRNDINEALLSMKEMSTSLLLMAATVNKWKGIIFTIVVAAQLLGPLLVFAARLIFFGKPLSQ